MLPSMSTNNKNVVSRTSSLQKSNNMLNSQGSTILQQQQHNNSMNHQQEDLQNHHHHHTPQQQHQHQHKQAKLRNIGRATSMPVGILKGSKAYQQQQQQQQSIADAQQQQQQQQQQLHQPPSPLPTIMSIPCKDRISQHNRGCISSNNSNHSSSSSSSSHCTTSPNTKKMDNPPTTKTKKHIDCAMRIMCAVPPISLCTSGSSRSSSSLSKENYVASHNYKYYHCQQWLYRCFVLLVLLIACQHVTNNHESLSRRGTTRNTSQNKMSDVPVSTTSTSSSSSSSSVVEAVPLFQMSSTSTSGTTGGSSTMGSGGNLNHGANPLLGTINGMVQSSKLEVALQTKASQLFVSPTSSSTTADSQNNRHQVDFTTPGSSTTSDSGILSMIPGSTSPDIVPGSNEKNDHMNRILQYKHSMLRGKDVYILFQWNPDGSLQRHTPIARTTWLDDDVLRNAFSLTSPSAYGKVAIVFNTDILNMINWNVVPPVPVMLFTMPDTKQHVPDQYQLVPNPCDRRGSEKFVNNVLSTVGYNVTYEQYQNRYPTIVWRGSFHGDHEPTRAQLADLSRLNGTIVTNESPQSNGGDGVSTSTSTTKTIQWLDARNTKDNPSVRIDLTDMAALYKYQIDVGGISGTSWCGLRWKMCGSGSLVFRIETFSQDWWHHTIKPYEHYIPVKNDLSNLYEQYMWAENHPQLAYEIAQRGQQQCLQSYQIQNAVTKQKEIIMNLAPTSLEIVNDTNDIFDKYYDEFNTKRIPMKDEWTTQLSMSILFNTTMKSRNNKA